MPDGPTIVPADHQPALRVDELILEQTPGEDAVPLDVLFVGGGPAGLAGAIELARLARGDDAAGDLEIGVLEKAQTLGGHCLSGAVVNAIAFRELFPDLEMSALPLRNLVERDRFYWLTARRSIRLPLPPPMRNDGNATASICEIVRWLGERAEALGIHLLTGYPAEALLVEGRRVIGARTTASGLTRDGEPGPGYGPPTDLSARVTVLAEGTRGTLTQAYLAQQGVESPNPQIYALGVKELWRVPRPLDAVIHTGGWPLPRDVFGGSWMYPMGDDLVSLGLVVGLDYSRHALDVHDLSQRLKLHPLFRRVLEGGEIVEWGAKTIPEGGFHALPRRLSGDGVVIVGDAAGFVDVPSLKGIHYAMQSGIFAARAIFAALCRDDYSAAALGAYDTMVAESFIGRDLYRRRNVRLGFKAGPIRGVAGAAMMTLTGGRFPGRRIAVEPDADVPRTIAGGPVLEPDGKYTFSKMDAVFHADNGTRDDIPSHLAAGDAVTADVASFYEHMCPAGVYEWQNGQLVVNAPNCIDCKATDVLGPRWSPREGGSGPSYKNM
jgi:electron-transferring-flavoprotein dehydrogenase